MQEGATPAGMTNQSDLRGTSYCSPEFVRSSKIIIQARSARGGRHLEVHVAVVLATPATALSGGAIAAPVVRLLGPRLAPGLATALRPGG